MTPFIVIVGIISDAATRFLVARKRVNTWVGMTGLFVVLSAAALATGDVAAGDVGAGPAIGVGLSVAVAFFAATRIALGLLARWPRFRQDARELYAGRDDYPISIEAGLGAVVACGEEIFWRGLVLPWCQTGLGSAGGAALALLGYAGTAAAAASMPVVIGALVGGAVWTGLALWSGGVLAGAVSHGLWTVLMIVSPPRVARQG